MIKTIRLTAGAKIVLYTAPFSLFKLGFSWFSGPTLRSLNLELGHIVLALILEGGYGYAWDDRDERQAEVSFRRSLKFLLKRRRGNVFTSRKDRR